MPGDDSNYAKIFFQLCTMVHQCLLSLMNIQCSPVVNCLVVHRMNSAKGRTPYLPLQMTAVVEESS